MGGEVWDFATKEQDLLMQRRDKTGHRYPLVRRYLFQDPPKHILKAHARALAVESDRPCLEGVAVRGLACKKVAHVSSFDRLFPVATIGCLRGFPSAIR
jgi:hypothetical protein